MSIDMQLNLLGHAVRTLEADGCRVLEARASMRALPLILLAGATPCPPQHVRGEPLHECVDGVKHCTVETHLGVCVTWVEVGNG